MFSITILAVGTMKRGAMYDLVHTYQKRMQWRVVVKECKHNKDLSAKIDRSSPVIAMDENGKNMTSRDVAKTFQTYMNTGDQHLQIVIGGADGLPPDIKKSAGKTLAFGKQTWPHMMVRVMLMEQLYRAQQILNDHPYHRD